MDTLSHRRTMPRRIMFIGKQIVRLLTLIPHGDSHFSNPHNNTAVHLLAHLLFPTITIFTSDLPMHISAVCRNESQPGSSIKLTTGEQNQDTQPRGRPHSPEVTTNINSTLEPPFWDVLSACLYVNIYLHILLVCIYVNSCVFLILLLL